MIESLLNKKHSIISNLIWKFLERCGAQGVTFVVSLILARLLEPDMYGSIALVSVFTSIIQVFVDSGLGNALIQKKNADDLDFSTVFIFNITACCLLYILLFLLAPIIARFYKNLNLIPIIRVMSLTLIISGFKNIQQAYISKNMLFKKFFFSTLTGTICAAIIGVYLAWKGYGVWALIIQNILNQIIDTLFLWCTVNWRPKKIFSFNRLKLLYNYGWKMLISALIDTSYNEFRSLIIGRKYTTQDLAYYNQGQKFPNFIITNINSSINSVLLPTLSAEQDSIKRVKGMTKMAIKISTYLIMPLMTVLSICAESFVSVILTKKWLPCVLFLRVYCFAYSLYPIHTANLNAIQALGRSDIFLMLEIIKKCIGILVIIITMRISVNAMAFGVLFTSVISLLINSWPNKELLNYSYSEQLKDILPQTLLSVIMGTIVWIMSFLPFNDNLILIIQILAGVITYFGLSIILHVDILEYLISIIKGIIKSEN